MPWNTTACIDFLSLSRFEMLPQQLGGGVDEQDGGRCVSQTDGSLQVNEGWRTLPYLGTGSIGIGLVLQEFLVHRASERYADALAQISLAAQSDYYAQPGLFNGRAGALLFGSAGLPELVACTGMP